MESHRCQANFKYAVFCINPLAFSVSTGIKQRSVPPWPVSSIHWSFFKLMRLSPVDASLRKGQAEWKMQCHRLYALKPSRCNKTTVSSFCYAWVMSLAMSTPALVQIGSEGSLSLWTRQAVPDEFTSRSLTRKRGSPIFHE